MNTHRIGILFSDQAGSGLTHDFFGAILDSVWRTMSERGYQISFFNTHKDVPGFKTYVEQTREQQYDGIVVACIDYSDPDVDELIHYGLPCVTIDYGVDGVISVNSDNVEGMRSLVRYILEMGHKRIGYMRGDDNGSSVSQLRYQAFLDTCKEAGVEVPPEYVKQSKFRDIDLAAYYTEELVRLKEPPTCIIYSDDYAAIGGINVLRARGMDLPGDMSVAGFDGIMLMSQIEPRITTVTQDTYEIGRVAAQELLDWVENPDYVLKNSIMIPTKLEKGRSVGKVYF